MTVALSGIGGPVLTVTLDRPDALNALNDELLDALHDAWLLARDPGVEVVVVTGAGRAFCAGADLHTPIRTPDEIAENTRKRYNAHVLALAAIPAPVVMAVNGPAVGAGLALACAGDVRIGSERADFRPGFARVGAVPDAGATYFVPRLIGYGRAFNWLCTNRVLGAHEALEWGLLDEVVAHGDLAGRARERAEDLIAVPGRAVPLTKRLLLASGRSSLAEQLEREAEAQAEAVADPDRATARAAVAASTSHAHGA